MSSSTHLAAILTSFGKPLEVVKRETPTPGPNEVLVEVKALALNPIDYYQRDFGRPPITHQPAVIGSDIGGIVVASGSAVKNPLAPGTRVIAFAPTFFNQGRPDNGAFQEKALLPSSNIAPIPNSLSFTEAATLPMAVVTNWSGWYSAGLPRTTHFSPSDKQGLLVWGGSSSVGSVAVQMGKIFGFTVYATASPQHHEYLKTIGANKAFDYKSGSVIPDIIAAAKADGITVRWGYSAAGGEKECKEILAALRGSETAKLASAPHPKEPEVEGVEIAFASAPKDIEARTEHFEWVFSWLKEKLETGELVSSPKIKIVGKGLEALNGGLDELRKGVSGEKLVVEL